MTTISTIESLIKDTDTAVRKLYAASPNRDSLVFNAVLRAVDKMTLWAKGDFEGLWLMEREDKERLENQLKNTAQASAAAPCLNLDTGFDEESPIEHDDETGSLAIRIGFPTLQPQSRFAPGTPLSDLGSPVPSKPVPAFQPLPTLNTLLPSPIRRAPFLEEFF